MSECRISVAQIDNVVGDIEGNAKRIIEQIIIAKQHGAHLVVFPELALTGYPPEDLLLRPGFHQRTEKQLAGIASASVGITVLCGHPRVDSEGIYNSASWFAQGELSVSYDKRALPNYGVFDEKRYFTAGERVVTYEVNGFCFATLICEDVWQIGPVEDLLDKPIDAVLVINASPFKQSKYDKRRETIAEALSKLHCPLIYVHCVGGQDDLVFDGGSFALNSDGSLAYQGAFFQTALDQVCLRREGTVVHVASEHMNPCPTPNAALYAALCCGVKSYVRKNNFNGVLIGTSGGIDSALSIAVAVDALGPQAVEVVAMPSPYTSALSTQAAKEQADMLGIKYHQLAIESLMQEYARVLSPLFMKTARDITEENLQARIRGTLLMAMSNKFHLMLLTTGNKSEYAVGYCTLYGDMCGGFAVLKDVFKTQVYALAQFRNEQSNAIPPAVISRAPTAELSDNQFDQDTLPSYDVLDKILKAYVEQDLGLDAIVSMGFSRETVLDVLARVDNNEYKRRQAPLGVRVSDRAFGRERRYPISSSYGLARRVSS